LLSFFDLTIFTTVDSVVTNCKTRNYIVN